MSKKLAMKFDSENKQYYLSPRNKNKKGFTLLFLFLLTISLIFLMIFFNPFRKNTNNSALTELKETEKDLGADSIINSQPIQEPTVITPKEIKLLFTGDNMLALSIGERIKSGENIYSKVRNDFLKYDYIIINLETNISEEGVGKPNTQKNWRFNAPLESLELLSKVGINIVNLGNNHTMDYGKDGLLNQIALLSENDIKYFGAGENLNEASKPLILEKYDTKIALIGFNDAEPLYSSAKTNSPGTAPFNKTDNKNAINSAVENSDILIVSAHSGTEGSTKKNSKQQDYYHNYIDWEADLVIGHHPHVAQEIEKYKEKMIYYSLGNFVFETGERELYKKALAVEVIIDTETKSIKEVNTIDVILENGTPSFNLKF